MTNKTDKTDKSIQYGFHCPYAMFHTLFSISKSGENRKAGFVLIYKKKKGKNVILIKKLVLVLELGLLSPI